MTWDPINSSLLHPISPADFDVIDFPHHQSHPRGATGTAKQQLRKQTVYH